MLRPKVLGEQPSWKHDTQQRSDIHLLGRQDLYDLVWFEPLSPERARAERLFTAGRRWARNLRSVVFPHPVRRKNIAQQRPANHPRYRHPIRQLHESSCPKRGKHPSKPHKCAHESFTPTKVGRNIGAVSLQVLANITHLFILAHNGCGAVNRRNSTV